MYKENDNADRSIIRQGVDWGTIGKKFQHIIIRIIEAAKYIFSEKGGACDETKKSDVLDKWEKSNQEIIESEKQNTQDDYDEDADIEFIPNESKSTDAPVTIPDDNFRYPEPEYDDDDINVIDEIPSLPKSDKDQNSNVPNDDYDYYSNKPPKNVFDFDIGYDPYGPNQDKGEPKNKDKPNPYIDYYNKYRVIIGYPGGCHRYPRDTKVCKKDDAKKLERKKLRNKKLRMTKLKLKKPKPKKSAAKKLKKKKA